LAIAAPLNRFSHQLFGLLKPLLSRLERHSGSSDRLPDSFGAAEWLIIGMGRTGVAAYQSLSNQNQQVLGLDADPTVLEQLISAGRKVIYADVDDSSMWANLSLVGVKGIILTLPSFDSRINAIGQLRKLGFAGVIGTICYQVDDERLLTGQGASFVIHPLVEAGNQLAQQMMVDSFSH
jgi:Trk K+ transport system NAD-binding subunit